MPGCIRLAARGWVDWRVENKTTVVDDYNSNFRTKYDLRIRLLANGTLHGVLEGRIAKRRAYADEVLRRFNANQASQH